MRSCRIPGFEEGGDAGRTILQLAVGATDSQAGRVARLLRRRTRRDLIARFVLPHVTASLSLQSMKLIAILALSTAACGGTTAGNTSETCSPIGRTAATPSSDWNGTVFTLVMENKSLSSILGNSAAPF